MSGTNKESLNFSSRYKKKGPLARASDLLKSWLNKERDNESIDNKRFD